MQGSNGACDRSADTFIDNSNDTFHVATANGRNSLLTCRKPAYTLYAGFQTLLANWLASTSPIGDYGKVTMSYILANQLGYFAQSVAQPERAGTFGNPFDDLAHSFLKGHRQEEPLGVVPIGEDYVKGSAKLCQEGLDAMLANLRKQKTVNWKLKKTSDSVTLAHGSESKEGKVEWDTISGGDAYEKVIALLKAHPFKPTHRVYMGFRRSFQMLVAAARWVDNGGKFEEFKIPIVIRLFKNPREERHVRWEENTAKHVANPYSIANLASIVTQGREDENWSESEAQAVLKLKRGTAQQAYAWSLLHTEFPGRKIVDRLLMEQPPKDKETKAFPYVEFGWIPQGIQATDLRALIGRSDPDKKLPENVQAAYDACTVIPELDGKRYKSAPENVVETFLQHSVEGRTRSAKTVTEKSVTNQASQFPAANPLNGFLKALASGDSEKIVEARRPVKQAFEELEALRVKVVELTTERDAIAQERDDLRKQVASLTPKATRKGSKATV